MPTLNWIGKDKIVNHHLDVPFHVLEHKYGYTAENGQQEECTNSGNMIIHGDNLTALKSLLPQYEGRVDCVYIDPPYNTGEEKWIYNDNVSDPHVNKWLGDVVGKEGEDLSRHDKWICMMYPRLKLLYKLLSADGLIFISIDDNECYFLKLICDSIFGSTNFVTNFIWEKRKNRENRKVVSIRHDYILCYSKNKKINDRYLNLLPMTGEALSRYKNPDNDPNGLWKSDPVTAQAGHATKDQFYTLTAPKGNEFLPPAGRCWIYTKDVMDCEIKKNHIWFGEDGNNVPRKKTYLYDKDRGLVPESIWFADAVKTTEFAKNNIKEIFQNESPFETPKPVDLIQRILDLATSKNSIILDSYAGSGVTGHAVIKKNKSDNGNRKFILIELMDYAETITAERIKRVISGYDYNGKKEEEIYCHKLSPKDLLNGEDLLSEANNVIEENTDSYDKISKPKIDDNCLKVIGTKNYKDTMPGLGGSFDYYELGEPLFKEDENLNEKVGEDKIREYIYYSETRQSLSRKRDLKHKYLLDTYKSTGYYFYYEPNKLTTLGLDTLGIVGEIAEQYIIYADVCTLSKEYMTEKHIIFKKIPRDIKRF